jgi:hypothetical protein
MTDVARLAFDAALFKARASFDAAIEEAVERTEIFLRDRGGTDAEERVTLETFVRSVLLMSKRRCASWRGSSTSQAPRRRFNDRDGEHH